jgi:hypothetical protein
MSGFRTLGFLLVAPFLIGGLVIGIFGFDEYNIIIVPLVMIGEAILVLVGIIDVEENKVEENHGINTIDDSNKNGEESTKPAM